MPAPLRASSRADAAPSSPPRAPWAGARNYLLGKDQEAGNTYYHDLMVQCKTFIEGADEATIKDLDSMESTRRPLAGNFNFQVFTHPSGENKGVIIFSPCKFSQAMKDEWNAMGGVKGILVPHGFHTAFVAAYLAEWPEVVMFLGPGITAELKPHMFTPRPGPFYHYEEGGWDAPEAVAFKNEWDVDIVCNDIGGFPEANFFHKPSGMLCTADIIYRNESGETFDWCTPNEVAPEWKWIDVLYCAPQWLPAEEVDPGGGTIAFYRYYMNYTLGNGEQSKAAFERIKALPGLRAIAACHADCAGFTTSRALQLLERSWGWSWSTGPEMETKIRTFYADRAKEMFAAAEGKAADAVQAFTTTTTTVTEASASGATKTVTTTVASPAV